MMESEAPCVDVAQQMHAVTSALSKAKQAFIHDHIEHCLDEDISSHPKLAKVRIKEFKDITKYL